MALLTLQEIKDGLDREFLPLEPMLLGLRMIEKETSSDAIEHCENHLAVKFPSSFRNLIAAFEFGQLTIGPVVFCSSGDYLAELITLNERVNWWGEGERPSNLILIGNSDTLALLLDTRVGHVLTLDVEVGLAHVCTVAKDFEYFLRGVGTIMLLRSSVADKFALGEEVCAEVLGQDAAYWRVLAS